MWGTYNLLTFKIIIQCCYYLCTCRSVVVEFYPWFKFCYPLFETHYHTLPYRKTKVKLISNRWAWALLPTKLVEPRNALAWGGGIHGNPVSSPYQALSHWAIQWNTYRPILTWPIPQKGGREEGMGKNQSTKWHANSNLLQHHFAKNCKQATTYTSHEVPPLEAPGHPQYSWKNCWLALLRG